MKKKCKKNLWWSICFLAAFVLWTALVCSVDVRPVGPNDSLVGFATLNQWFHETIGVHWFLYMVTDWLGLVPIGFMLCFAFFGLIQWIKRKKLLKVDHSILALGIFYVVVMAVYFLFEVLAINYRPVLIEGVLEASYPSSTTLLVLCVLPTAMMQFHDRIKNRIIRGGVQTVLLGLLFFMLIGRVLSGVHWITDIIGGALLSAGLVRLYDFIVQSLENKKDI